MAISPLGIALSEQQPIMPAKPGQVAPTDVLGAYQTYINAANTQYQAKLQQQNALWGGLAQLGGAGIIGGSKVPAIQDAVSNLLSPGTGASSYSGLASNASTLGDWMSDPVFDAIGSGASSASAPAVSNLGADAATGGSSDLASGASSLGSWLSDPALASIGSAAPAASSVFDTGAAALPYAAGSTVAADLGAAAPAIAAGGDAAATGGGMALADLIPLMFA